ncbi:DUF3262 family protein [Aromatoleum bremense]|uniref:DUF3262 family protein n=2 Tax=Aromatoleum bremense TaxID=76115 RepID=A0ABX1NW47_9RHOO|nr:DUF3262 family protein [Aromatoleum bremense]
MRPDVINGSGYAGLFQFGEAALQDVGLYAGDATPHKNDWTGSFSGKYGVTSLAGFLANPDAQIRAVTAYHAQAWNTLAGTYGAAGYLGTTLNGIEITRSGLVAAAHLLGAGTVGEWLESGGTTNPADGNGTPLTAYLSKFAGYALGATAPSYAALRAADPAGATTGAGYVYTDPPLGSSGGGSGAVALLTPHNSHAFTSAAQGFHAATGYPMGELRDLLAGLAATAALTWMAYVVISKWHAFNGGTETIREMTFDILRAMVVTSIVLLLMV